MSKVWAVKYRPSIDDIVGQDRVLHQVSAIQHFIFYSKKAGTGKTSLAHALAEQMGWPIHVFNASSKKTRGIDFVEEELLPITRSGNYHQFILLDEADQLTPAAQSALKGVIENAQGYFILTCNDLSKVSEWLKSRCMVCKFKDIEPEQIAVVLAKIAGREGVHITEGGINLIVNSHKGDLRNSINCLQAYASLDDMHGQLFLRNLSSLDINSKLFLQMAFKEKDYDAALSVFEGYDKRQAIQEIFLFAMDGNAKSTSKLKLINAAVVAERDFLSGVDEYITLANFVRLCCE
tara:strand:+ start:10008 stop:10883 length:876 start_codon:yes stop_codon:yes gene_type:complete